MNNRRLSKPTSSTNNAPSADPKAGLVLLLTLILVIVTATLSTALLFAARNSTRTVRRWTNYDNALWAAQTALEKVKSQIHEGFEEFHKSTYSWNNIYWIEENASDYSISNITLGALISNAVVHLDYTNARLSIVVSNGTVTGAFDARSIPITVTATATLGDSTRTLEEVFEYKLTRSTVFDHAYFMNNFGWMYGVNLVFNGDVRSNFDFDWRTSKGALNANSFAAGENLISSIPLSYSEAEYIAAGNPFARPLKHPDSTNAAFTISKGYDPTTGGSTINGATPIKMPYIGELSDVVAYAHHKAGTISQGGAVIVDAFYDGVGPSGVAGAPDEGCLVLIGTPADPIVINGPVVIEGDVLIKGYYTGQGTIYAGRNAHVLDDVIALNPPQWSPNDTEDNYNNNTLPNNLAADFLGLCSKGNLTLGDYRQSYNQYIANKYGAPPFTHEYEVSASDAAIGYAQYQKANGDWYFDGDYTATFGEKCDNANPANGVPRKYYESSLSDDLFDSLNPSARIQQFDGLIYNNHLTTGTWDYNSAINGGFICRDEAMAAKGRLDVNWDPRVGSDQDNGFQPFLPMRLAPSKTITWREVPVP